MQVVLDENVQAEGADYCDMADVSPSPGGHDLAAYAADMTGYEVSFLSVPPFVGDELVASGCAAVVQ